MVDLATNKIDVEPIKNKESETALKAMKHIFTRKILTMSYFITKLKSNNNIIKQKYVNKQIK